MNIKKITNQLENDIYGILYCEHCGYERKFIGYADDHYFNKVLPSFYCAKCGKK